jgi:hypothetical protein
MHFRWKGSRPPGWASGRERLNEAKNMAMQTRRKYLLMIVASVVALAGIVVPAIADELLGVLIKVDAPAKKLTVVQDDTNKEVIVTITDDTEYVSKKGSSKVDMERLEKFAKGIEKAKENGKKGISVKVTHDKGVASKIEQVRKAQ